ncbi:MFS transporter, partial [Lentilactobacillus parabuchneri]|uniref:MFS transporter n=1 Tax=Lentilactobacillus parabuchneri TaxID=152331 RepID=UPI00117BAFA4
MHSPTIKHRGAFVATLLTGTFSMSISQSSLSTAYPAFMKAFGLGADTVAWLTTGFMLVMTLMIPEAIAVGIIFPSFQTVLLTITPHSERGRVMGTAGLVMGSALAVGPIISGVLLTWFPWQALFLFFLVVSLLVLAVSTVTIASVMPLQPTQLDWVSFLLSASFPILLYALGALSKKGLTVGVVGLLILGVLAAGIFVVRQLNRQPPMLQMRVFATGMFTKAVFLTGISYVGLIVTTILMPLYFQTLLGLSPLISGLSLVLAFVLRSA